ncbi:MAG: hypothetical protein J5697_04200 [Clostridia bacterium]|nr:hypothetical protein [Clostridia bacterium]
MARICVSENVYGQNNLLYVQSNVAELLRGANCKTELKKDGDRANLYIDCPDCYKEIISIEISDKIAEIIAVKYKYDYFKNAVKIAGISDDEKEILFASLIAADLPDDKKYVFGKIKGLYSVAIDGVYNFWLKPLKKKWSEIVTYIPLVFERRQLKEFVSYLLENKKKRVYVDGEKVYDSNYKRLYRVDLLPAENVRVIREIILSNCGEIELFGVIPKDDEYYLKEFYTDKIIFSARYFG